MTAGPRFILALILLMLAGAALILGLWPAPSTLRQPPVMAADARVPRAMSEAWSGTFGALLGAVLGGVLGFMAAWLPKHWDDRQKRRALATLLLSEIRFMEGNLREIYYRGVTTPDFGFQTAIYDEASANLLLFSPPTVQALNVFYQHIHNLPELRTMGDVNGWLGVAYQAACYIPEVATRLRDEGGEWPRPYGPPPSPWEPRDLPPPMFEGHE
jgi:hypothetical protein